jgi:hypothetical protein
MNRDKRSIIIGMLLGDGCIKIKPHTLTNGDKKNYYEFCIAHSPKQLRYLQWKGSKLHSIFGGKVWKVSEGSTTLSNSVTYQSFRVSKQHPYFKLLHRWAYSNNNKKYFTRSLLDKLSPEGIAYWYMDDGSLVKTVNNTGGISSFQIRLYTYCSLEEANTIKLYFKDTYDIEFNISKHTGKEQYCLRCNTKEGTKFLNLIHKYKAPDMEYKFLEPRMPSSLFCKDEDIV